jgi:hypothetical protein
MLEDGCGCAVVEEGIDSARVYLLGVSSGALMTNVMATYPDLYHDAASVEGCSYLCSDPTGDVAYQRMGVYAREFPMLVVQGSLDYLTNPAMGELTVTQWLGANDLADDGLHNTSVSPIPASTEQRNLDSFNRSGRVRVTSALMTSRATRAHSRRPASRRIRSPSATTTTPPAARWCRPGSSTASATTTRAAPSKAASAIPTPATSPRRSTTSRLRTTSA